MFCAIHLDQRLNFPHVRHEEKKQQWGRQNCTSQVSIGHIWDDCRVPTTPKKKCNCGLCASWSITGIEPTKQEDNKNIMTNNHHGQLGWTVVPSDIRQSYHVLLMGDLDSWRVGTAAHKMPLEW